MYTNFPLHQKSYEILLWKVYKDALSLGKMKRQRRNHLLPFCFPNTRVSNYYIKRRELRRFIPFYSCLFNSIINMAGWWRWSSDTSQRFFCLSLLKLSLRSAFSSFSSGLCYLEIFLFILLQDFEKKQRATMESLSYKQILIQVPRASSSIHIEDLQPLEMHSSTIF